MSAPFPHIQGVIPVLQTPFHGDGSLDFDSLRRELQFACAAGCAAVAFPGFVSEWWKLSDEEILECASLIGSSQNSSTLFIANITAQSTFGAVAQAEQFLKAGAGALMCLPPFIFPPAEDHALDHLRAVLSIDRVPMILQLTEFSSHGRFGMQQLVSLHHEYPNFCCVKLDFSPAGPALTQFVHAFHGLPITFLVGFGGLHLPDSVKRGANGLMPGTGHLSTDMQVFQELQHQPQTGVLTFEQLLPLINFEMQTVEFSIAVHKWLLRECGVFGSDYIRPPGFQMDRIHKAELAGYMDRITRALKSSGSR